MRILIAGYAYEDSFADNARCALEDMGHEVRTLGVSTQGRILGLFRRSWCKSQEEILKRSVQPDENKLLAIARAFQPQVILALTRDYSSETLAELKRISGPALVIWWGDPPANARRWAFMDSQWDLVFLKDAAAVEKTRLIRNDVYLLHEAMNPTWHSPVASQANEQIVVAGNYYAFRQLLVDRLMRDGHDIALYGSGPPAWSLASVRERHSRKYIVRDDKSRVFGQGLACLNSFQPAEGNSLNCRAFEIAGAGGLQLIEHRPAIEQCFEPGKELLVFRNYDELLELIERARQAPDEMRLIRQAGAARAAAEHTYRHRMETILACL